MAAFDIQTTRVDIYGQGAGYSERSMVIYDGGCGGVDLPTPWAMLLAALQLPLRLGDNPNASSHAIQDRRRAPLPLPCMHAGLH